MSNKLQEKPRDWFRTEDSTIYYLAYINKPIPKGSHIIQEITKHG